jgi:hypothetical protein
MGDDLAYRHIEIYRLGGALPELIGTFVVGIPKRAIEDFRAKNRFFSDDTVFRTLISAGEHQKMREWLKVPLEGGNIEQNLPFASDPETLGEPTFEGGDWKKVLVSNVCPAINRRIGSVASLESKGADAIT